MVRADSLPAKQTTMTVRLPSRAKSEVLLYKAISDSWPKRLGTASSTVTLKQWASSAETTSLRSAICLLRCFDESMKKKMQSRYRAGKWITSSADFFQRSWQYHVSAAFWCVLCTIFNFYALFRTFRWLCQPFVVCVHCTVLSMLCVCFIRTENWQFSFGKAAAGAAASAFAGWEMVVNETGKFVWLCA